MSLVTVITATTGSKYLPQCIKSVRDQDYDQIQHLIFADGFEHASKVKEIIDNIPIREGYSVDVIYLPYSVGSDRYNGHRMYGAGFYFCKGDFVCFLDDDNWFDSDHISSMVSNLDVNSWSYSLRKIVDADGNFVCNDDCESLGEYPSILSDQDYFVDQNCYMFPKMLGLQLTPLFYRRFREPNEMELDRLLVQTMRHHKVKSYCNNKYSVNYRAGNTINSVQANFFTQGNAAMLQRYNNKLPWKE